MEGTVFGDISAATVRKDEDHQQNRITGEILLEKKTYLSTYSYISFPIPPAPSPNTPAPSPSPATIAVRAVPSETILGVRSSIPYLAVTLSSYDRLRFPLRLLPQLLLRLLAHPTAARRMRE